MLARLTMVSSLTLFAAAAPAEDWNQWRGPYRDGALADSPPLIDELPTEGLSPVWVTESEVPTGGKGGWSSPVVADGRVFVFAHLKNRRQDVELPPEKYPRLDEEAGAQLTSEERDEYERNRRLEQQRRRELEFQYLERLVCFDAQTGRQLWANERESRLTRFPQSASPAVVDGVVYVHGARGMVWAVSAETGGDLWRLQLPGEFDDEPHPASVAVADGVVIVLAGRLFGVDAARGQLLWQGEEEIRSDHASPALWWHDGAAHVVAHAGRETLCLSAKDGRERWRVESLAGRSSPVVVGDRLVTYGNSRKGGVRCFAISPERAEHLWTNTAVADEGCSPVVVDGHLYVHGDRRMVCIDLESGKTMWRRELDIDRPRYTSLIAADDTVIFAAGGLLCVAADAEKYRLLVNGRFDRDGRLASEAYFRQLWNIDELELTAEGQKRAESLWRKHVGNSGPAQCVSPAMAEGHIFLRLKNDRVACYDLRLR